MINVSAVNKIFGRMGTKSHWVNPLHFFVFNITVVGNIFMSVKYFFIVGQRGTESYWFNPLQCFKLNDVKVFDNDLCLKTVLQ